MKRVEASETLISNFCEISFDAKIFSASIQTRAGISWLLLFLLLILPASGQAQFLYATNNGTITITGYTGSGGAVTIPSTIAGLPVTGIGDSAFQYDTVITSVLISDSVTNIGSLAFYQCTNLIGASVGCRVVSIGDHAFESCSSLGSIFFYGNPPNAGVDIFSGDTNLTVYYFSGRTWGSTFSGFPTSSFLFSFASNSITGYTGSSKLVIIPETLYDNPVTSIGKNVFINTGITNVIIPDSITNIGDGAFFSCWGLRSFTIPDSITSIGNNAFCLCSNLGSILIGNGVTDIGADAFSGCYSVTNIAIPNSVITIGGSAFNGCGGLSNDMILSAVVSIGDFAFAGGGMTTVTMGDRVTSIGAGAFGYNRSLTGLYFEGNAPNADSSLFMYDNSPTVYYLPETTGWSAFATNVGVPTVLWNPQMQTGDGSFGVQNNQFGFDITGTTNIPIVVEAATNLADASWTALQSCKLTNGLVYFSDPDWTNYPSRFYRIRSP